jgi:hypothetical protein
MNIEVQEAIRIADKHLAGHDSKRRMALALDIQNAIARCGGLIANDLIREAFKIARENKARAESPYPMREGE